MCIEINNVQTRLDVHNILKILLIYACYLGYNNIITIFGISTIFFLSI